jgi:hypothetical protein
MDGGPGHRAVMDTGASASLCCGPSGASNGGQAGGEPRNRSEKEPVRIAGGPVGDSGREVA